jgi:hypothetical protein
VPAGEEPVVKVVKGDPTPEELAALVAVVTARMAAAPEPGEERAGDWASYWRNVRRPLEHGPGRWRASAFPR